MHGGNLPQAGSFPIDGQGTDDPTAWLCIGIEVPVYYWPAAPQTLLRISAQAYNALGQYERLAEALQGLLAN